MTSANEPLATSLQASPALVYPSVQELRMSHSDSAAIRGLHPPVWRIVLPRPS